MLVYALIAPIAYRCCVWHWGRSKYMCIQSATAASEGLAGSCLHVYNFKRRVSLTQQT
jgi:hypothetical protein